MVSRLRMASLNTGPGRFRAGVLAGCDREGAGANWGRPLVGLHVRDLSANMFTVSPWRHSPSPASKAPPELKPS